MKVMQAKRTHFSNVVVSIIMTLTTLSTALDCARPPLRVKFGPVLLEVAKLSKFQMKILVAITLPFASRQSKAKIGRSTSEAAL